MCAPYVFHKCRLATIALALATFIHLSSDSHAGPPLPWPGINNPGPQDLHYILDLATDGGRPRFFVNLYFQGNADGASKLRLPNGWDTQKQLYKAIRNLRAPSPETKIDDTTEPHIKTITYSANQIVHLQYDVIQDWPGAAVRHGLFNRVILQTDYFYALGTAFWVLPDWEGGRSVNVRLQWKNLPGAWMLCNSFGTNEGSQTFQTTLEGFRKGVFLAGDFRVHRLSIRGRPIQLATRGKWKFPDTEFYSLVQKVIETERSFWDNYDFPRYLVVLFPTDDPPGGSGEARTDALALYFSKDIADTSAMRFLLAHEMFHAWNAARLGRRDHDDGLYWFSEGFTDHYAALLLWRAKIISPAEYIERVNGTLGRYYTSRCRNYPYERLQAERGRNSEAERQLCARGHVLAMYWDASIRFATGGKASLDDVMRELFRAARDKGLSLSKDSIDRAARRYIKEGVRQDIDRYVELGATIPIHDNLLGPITELSVIEIGASFDPGFDIDATFAKRIFTGVQENGPAYHAGLRDGQKLINGGLVFDDPTTMAEFTVEDSGMRKVVKYYPASGEKVRVPRYNLKALPEKKD
jgi:predicted metalloprotease with PDZ domain